MVMDIYVAMADGFWLYEPRDHTLLLHAKDDIRAPAGLQDFVGTAPLNLIYVAHGERMIDHFRRGASALRVGRYRLHGAKRLSVLRLGGPRHCLSGSGGWRKAKSNPAASRSVVRNLCPDGRLWRSIANDALPGKPRRMHGHKGILPGDQRSLAKPYVGGELLHDEIRDVGASDCPAMDA
jgi:hypothetical protein